MDEEPFGSEENMLRTLSAFVLLFAATSTNRVNAQEYPNKSVTIIVPFTAGGATDILGRITAEALQAGLKQTFVVENRTGAGGVIGYTAVSRAVSDGYTLLFAPTAFSIVPFTTTLSYDPRRDLKPISLVAYTANVMIVPGNSKAKSVAEFIELAKKAPEPIIYASPGVGTPTHLGVEAFAAQAGIRVTHVPYRGVSESINDLIGGQIDMMFADLPAALPLADAGKIRILGVLTKEPHPALPAIPTVAATLPGFYLMGWQGLFAPGGTPEHIVEKLNKVLVEYLKTSAAADRMRKIGVDVAWTTPKEMGNWVDSQLRWWGSLAKQSGIQPK
jgi:tripartite-type tricarboxylate transporter receptor subunit TctC